MADMDAVIDLTADDDDTLKRLADHLDNLDRQKKEKRAAEAVDARAKKKSKPTKAASKTHALLWICAAGKGQGRAWKKKALRVVGVYADKASAEAKKAELMEQYTCCGHGDIITDEDGTWEDEIDLVIRPVEEMSV